MKRPFITISYAQSLDGRIASASGDSKWISGSESLQFAHELRNTNQGILVGIGTVEKDNPQLTCRIPSGKNPIRIIIDTNLRISPTAQILDTQVAPTWIFHGPNAKEKSVLDLSSKGVRLFNTPLVESKIALTSLLNILFDQGLTSLFVEGGSSIITSFLRERFVDRLAVVVAPIIIGKGVEAVGDLGIQTMKEALYPDTISTKMLGKDTLFDMCFNGNV